ncbi:MAG: ATP-dependent RNA helicase HrpA, partial [Gammaproteobacteria bacterium]
MQPSALAALAQDLPECMLADRGPFEKRLRALQRRARQGRAVDSGMKELSAAVARSRAVRERRLAALPVPQYPDALPVVLRREEIRSAIAAHQVVIVCGETGSGKTTQLPKICLELGRGVAGMIGHTQPRRIAARSLAARIAEELRSAVGRAVGYKVRFNDRVGQDSFIKVMTDGILLAETQGDRDLSQYDTLIIDEAHERSLNIDFLLGYLKQLLPRRPDLKVIITSATIDPERFSRHFDDAPVIEVSGRTYPVEIRYRGVEGGTSDTGERDLGQSVVDAVDELARAGSGDVLVFLPGEREIRETAERLRKHHPPHTEILPLYARLSAAQQNRVFQNHRGRRIVLATNVAETSLTVPGIRYVVDTGLARISRYSYRTKVQRLPIEPVSQASADQRAGRCGRVAAGICIRLYGEEDYQARVRYTEPEIRRTNLASVILQMLSLGLGDIERFSFIDPPDSRYVRDGFKLLHELGAVDGRERLTDLGRQLARLPVDPRLGRMLLAARDEHCLEEALVIVSALAVQDPRERPLDQQQAADEKHRLFSDPRSDFLGYLKLWQSYHEQQRHLSQNKLRKWCREHFLSFMRLRDWHDTHRQLKELATGMGMHLNQVAAEYDAVHRALLTGLLGNVAVKTDAREYTGARNLKLTIFPGSALARKGPKWIMAAELLETARRYAHTVAAVEPQWVERLAGGLVKRNYFEPHWEKRAAQVAAFETVSLYGLMLAARRRVNFGPIDPVLSRELFIRGALVQGDYQTKARFFAHNRALIEEIEGLEAKSRRRDLLVDEALLYRFYDERIPAGIYSGSAFERWRREAERARPGLLELTREHLMQHGAQGITQAQFPDHLEIGGLRLALSYHFEPGSDNDGVTATVPLAAVNQLAPEPFEWLVPGLLGEKVTLLIKSLPKGLRRHFVPAPQFADACLQA